MQSRPVNFPVEDGLFNEEWGFRERQVIMTKRETSSRAHSP